MKKISKTVFLAFSVSSFLLGASHMAEAKTGRTHKTAKGAGLAKKRTLAKRGGSNKMIHHAMLTPALQKGRKAAFKRVSMEPTPAATAAPEAASVPQPAIDGLLRLQSNAALVVDIQTGERIFEKNANQINPIASITKLMTAMVVLDARQPLDELMTISQEDADYTGRSHSRLTVGTTLTRGEMLLLALMSSENRAANALARYYPGGWDAFIARMNQKAASIGMHHTRFVDPVGLSNRNMASLQDLVQMVYQASHYPEIRSYSTYPDYQFVSSVTGRTMVYNNTNRLVREPAWQISVSKTGFINAAGKCLVLQTVVDGRPLIMVLMDSKGRFTRIEDAVRVREWLQTKQRTQTYSQSRRARTNASG